MLGRGLCVAGLHVFLSVRREHAIRVRRFSGCGQFHTVTDAPCIAVMEETVSFVLNAEILLWQVTEKSLYRWMPLSSPHPFSS